MSATKSETKLIGRDLEGDYLVHMEIFEHGSNRTLRLLIIAMTMVLNSPESKLTRKMY